MNLQLSDNPIYVYNDNGDRYDISNFPDLEYHSSLHFLTRLIIYDVLDNKYSSINSWTIDPVYRTFSCSVL